MSIRPPNTRDRLGQAIDPPRLATPALDGPGGPAPRLHETRRHRRRDPPRGPEPQRAPPCRDGSPSGVRSSSRHSGTFRPGRKASGYNLFARQYAARAFALSGRKAVIAQSSLAAPPCGSTTTNSLSTAHPAHLSTKVLATSAWHKTPLTSHRIAPISAGRCQGLYVSVPKPGRRVANSVAGLPWEFKFMNSLAGIYCAATHLGSGVFQRRPLSRASWPPVAALLQRTHRVPASAEGRRPLACSSRGCGESPAASAFRTRRAAPAVRRTNSTSASGSPRRPRADSTIAATCSGSLVRLRSMRRRCQR